jgi:hypothetical protein
MKNRFALHRIAPLAVGAAAVALTASAGNRHRGEPEEIEFDEARLYFELNDTDGDLGIHGLWDGDAWKSIEIEDPNERGMLNIWVRGRLRLQGLTELFFESAEPNFDDLSPARFFRRFPEGTYEIEGMTLDGKELEAEVELSHTLAGPPGNIMVNDQASAVNCDADELPSVEAPVTIAWDAVTMSHPTLGNTGEAVTVEQYEFIAEIEREGETPETLVFGVNLPAGVTSFEIPENFTDLADEEVKFEIVTRLDNGNQTAVESCFELE